MLDDLIKIYDRDLAQLKTEIESFKDESNLWKTTGNVTNTAGNLCLHLTGNLNAFIGNNIGGSGYIRKRDEEFSLKNIPKARLLEMAEQTKQIIGIALNKMNKEQLEDKYPQNVFGYEMTNGFFLLHLAVHLSYHLGQINYLRRILE